MLSQKIPNPLVYVFYISCLGLLSLLLVPFTKVPSLNVFILASASTLIWSVGAYFLFYALKVGVASRVAPIIGTIVPILLMIYYSLFSKSISLDDLWGAIFLVLGLILIIAPYLRAKKEANGSPTKLKEFGAELLAGLFFAVSYILLKEVYNQVPFLTGLVWSRVILAPTILIILAIPLLRRIVLKPQPGRKIKMLSKTGLIFLVGQTAGGLSGILLAYAISLANPALVNSLQGTQYVFLFLVSLALSRRYPQIFKENLTKKIIILKILGIGLIGGGLFILAFSGSPSKQITLGISYSPRYAASLGLDPKATYLDMLQRLHPQTVRLGVYWDEVEPKSNSFDFTDLDYYIQTAQQFKVPLTLVVGLKVPRYPECYAPDWTKGLPSNDFDNALLTEMTTVVDRYKDLANLDYWQVENEPLFPFGVCPAIDVSRLQKEVKLVRNLDPNHQIILTESGEFGLWLTTAKLADVVGTTLYRRTLAPYYPEFRSPLPPFFYRFKGMLVHLLAPDRQIFVSELQAEPWSNKPLNQTDFEEQFKAFPVADLRDNVEFTKQANFDRAYLWGVEWWYYLAKQGYPNYLTEAALIFNDPH